jgi:hypothetical protein|tara:strand:- start:192 stop:503 length:312 start_codon:yes stop_codon:yes gene_type:complete
MWEIKDSKIHGKGIFAKEDINKGSLIGKAYDLIGEVNDKYIAGEITILGSIHNHSFNPNARPEIYNNQIFFEALNNISKGEEITCDYGEYYNILNIEKPKEDW